jgi:hypothetical protein
VDHVRRAPTKSGIGLPLRITDVTFEWTHRWHQWVQPFVKAVDGPQADKAWRWPLKWAETLLIEGLFGQQPRGFVVGVQPDERSFVPCIIMSMVEDYQVSHNGADMSASAYARIAERYQVNSSDDESVERFFVDVAPTLSREERETIVAELMADDLAGTPTPLATDVPREVPTFPIEDAPPITRPTSLALLVGELTAAVEKAGDRPARHGDYARTGPHAGAGWICDSSPVRSRE